jgi:hypothetical protein
MEKIECRQESRNETPRMRSRDTVIPSGEDRAQSARSSQSRDPLFGCGVYGASEQQVPPLASRPASPFD